MLEMPVLETARLIIRPFTPSDLESAHRILDIELDGISMGSGEVKSQSVRQEWLDWTLLNYRQLAALYQPPYGDRAIVLKGAGGVSEEVIGAVGYVPSFGPFGQLAYFGGQRRHNRPEFGLFYAITSGYRRKGFATEAARAMILYAFHELGLVRVVATTSYDNAASQAVMRRLGMRVEYNPFPDPPWFQVVGILENSQ